MSYRNSLRGMWALVSVGLMAGCDATVGVESPFATLVSITAEPAGANCAAGGSSVTGGIDNGQGGGIANDGLLSPGEVTSTNYICNGVNGAAGTAGTPGNNGIDGAIGVDGSNGSNGVDGAPGVDGSNGVDGNNGVDGAPGSDGTPGHNGLVKMTPVADGIECASGGQRIDAGVDDGSGTGGIADDHILESGEIDDTVYVCNGVSGSNGSDGSNGSNGSNGFDSVLRFSSEPVGAHCGEAGYRVEAGLDNGDGAGIARDGILQDGEVDTTAYLCAAPEAIGVIAYGNTYSNQVLAVSLADGTVTPLTTSNGFYTDALAFGGGAVAYSGYDPTISAQRATIHYGNSDYNLQATQLYGPDAIAVHGPKAAYVSSSGGSSDIILADYTNNVYTSLTNNTDPNTYYQSVDFDGDRFVYARVTSADWVWRLYLYDRATQTETHIGDGYYAKITGSHIVYNLGTDGSATVYDIIAGTTTNMSASVGSYGNYPVVGDHYAAFQNDNGMYVYNFANGYVTPVASSYRFRFVGGDTLVYLGDNSQTIYAYDPSTGLSRTVLHIDNTYFDFNGGP